MIAANVAAAETLEKHRSALLYRVHDTPSPEKLTALRDFLASLDLPFGKSDAVRPTDFNRVLAKARHDGKVEQVSEMVLRTPGAGRIFGRELRPFRPQSRPLCPLHLADPPLCRPDRPPRADHGARARRGRPDRRRDAASCQASPSTSPLPSAAPWRPSAKPPTGCWRSSLPARSAPGSRAAFPASPGRACSSGCSKPAPTASSPPRRWGRTITAMSKSGRRMIGDRTGEKFGLGDTGQRAAAGGGAGRRRTALRAAERRHPRQSVICKTRRQAPI